ncbi:TilS substrate-binding domain-containing protein [Lentibacter algarum]|uniref:TilS substrate-binding domain-containing protein n=1 Tax=Lentibacter algarum TaxID=576131 RepID=UPI003B596B83
MAGPSRLGPTKSLPLARASRLCRRWAASLHRWMPAQRNLTSPLQVVQGSRRFCR